MSMKVAELASLATQDDKAAWVSNLWDKFNQQRKGKLEEWKELRDYIFATDTTTTTAGALPWKNSTTTPKLCQIRDNLHSNYLSALFPNDNWLNWIAYDNQASTKFKADTIREYMANKTREGHFRNTCSSLLLDYIDYGNSFATVDYEANYREDAFGQQVVDYVGPVARRLSPMDIVFNPLADNFDDSFKVIRSVKTLGELKVLAETHPEQAFWKEALDRRETIRRGGYSSEDFDKAVGYSADGFGNMHDYFMSDYVEILEFYGDFHDAGTGSISTNRHITVVDRSYVAQDAEIVNWFGKAPIYHVGWRKRPDNAWAMGPLDNLVGMQYRIDHLENLKADALDLAVHPVLEMRGVVEEFEWAPGATVEVDEGGSIREISQGLQGVIAANNDIAVLEQRMEMYAGAPREAMGMRTAGEKTAFEVQQLQNAAGRIFQEKITHFEMELLEPLLNAMLETARRHLDETDLIRIVDKELGMESFRKITRADLVANGKIRPIGARHFSKQAQDMQSVMGVFNSPMAQILAPHTSALALSEFVNDATGLGGYGIFSPNIAIKEQQETQIAAADAEEEVFVQTTDTTGLQ